MNISFVVVSTYSANEVSVSTIAELMSVIREIDPLSQELILITDTGSIDIGYYIMEKPPSSIPTTIDALVAGLTDMDYDGYKVNNPFSGNKDAVKTYHLSEYDNLTAKLTNIEHPDKLSDIYVNQDKLPDIVLTTTRTDIDLSNMLLAVGGKIYPTHVFNKKLYILGAGYYITERNHTLIDFNPVGGFTSYRMSDLTTQINLNHDAVYLTLPGDAGFTTQPMLILRGMFFPIKNRLWTMVSTNTIMLSVSQLVGLKSDELLDYTSNMTSLEVVTEILAKWINTTESSIVVPTNKIFVTHKELSPVDGPIYNLKLENYDLYNMVISRFNQQIIPFKFLPAKNHITKNIKDHQVLLSDIPVPLLTSETDSEPVVNAYLNKPYHPYTRLPIDIYKMTR